MSKTRVLVVDDHAIVREGLCALLERIKDIEVLKSAANGREAVTLASKLDPHVVIMDISMSGMNGMEATRAIKRIHPQVKVLILSRHADDEYIAQALLAGAEGYLVKHSASKELELAIRAVRKGHAYLSPQITAKVLRGYLAYLEENARSDAYSSLTARERETFQLIAEGRSVREIADVMSISEKTVRSHRASLLSKMRMTSTGEVILYAVRQGLVQAEPG